MDRICRSDTEGFPDPVMADDLFHQLPLAKLAIENSEEIGQHMRVNF
jgi:hypothetical protein